MVNYINLTRSILKFEDIVEALVNAQYKRKSRGFYIVFLALSPRQKVRY